MSRAAQLRAEGHDYQAKAHACFAEAERLDSQAPANDDAAPASWIPTAACPLGNRTGLSLARAGAIESTKVGRKVLLRRRSLDAFLERHRRHADAQPDVTEENLFAPLPHRAGSR
jgi:excisionase family DNA binding protein